MTYETGTAIDLEDLLDKLDTFATTTHGGWAGYSTNPNTTNGWFELHKGSLSFSMKYPVGAQGPPLHASCHQATAFVNDSTAPGAHTGDSNNGFNTTTTGHTNANLLGERCVSDIGDGPFPSYHFYADDVDEDYIHVVVQATTGRYRHFGFGTLHKFGDNWVGGEYVYGQHHDAILTTVPVTDTDHTCLLDGLMAAVNELRGATVRIASGLANQGSAIWGVSVVDATLSTDTAGNPRRQIHGGFRAGMEARGFGDPVGNFSSGIVPMYSIPAYYRDPSNPRVYLLGYLPDIAALNIRNFEPGQSVTFDGDTWDVYPLSVKTTASVQHRSLFSGIAYKRVT